MSTQRRKPQQTSRDKDEGREYSSRNNSRKPQSRGRKSQRSKSVKERFADADQTTNDVAWYSTDPALLRDAASIPYSWSVGTSIDLHNPRLDFQDNKGKFAIPGIQVLRTAPSVGYTLSANDPVNLAANATYSFVRHANSGHANYDAPDLMLYITAMTQVYSYINWLQRLYACATLYSQQNRYVPDALIKAQLVDPEDVRNNLANFRYGINVLINKAATFYVPATMPIYAREAFMYSNIYTEGLSMKDQLYMYSPRAFWVYGLDPETQAGYLWTADLIRGNWKVAELLSTGNALLDPLLYSEDMNIMSGDILKAYQGNVIKLQSLPDEVSLLPVYDALVLEQMKNATVVGSAHLDLTNFGIKQNSTKSFLVHQPTLSWHYPTNTTPWTQKAPSITYQTLTEDRILTTQAPEPGPEVTMEITRLLTVGRDYQHVVDPNGDTVGSVKLYPGSEIVVDADFIYYHVNADGSLEYRSVTSWYSQPALITDDANDTAQFFRQLAVMRNFKFAPTIHYLVCKQGSTDIALSLTDGFIYQDVDNYAVLNEQDIAKLNETALLSLFHVPSITKL